MVRYAILLAIAILPIYLIGLYIYRKDKNKESKKLLRKIFIFGVLSCIPACIVELLIDYIFGFDASNMNLISAFLYYFLVVGLVEEFWKFFAAYKITYNHPEFDEVYDAIVFLAFAALGFAGFENVLYVLFNGFTTGIIRALASVPGHICYAVIIGNYMALAKQAKINNNKSLEKKSLFKGIILASLIHGVFDTCCSGNLYLIGVFLFLVIFIYVYGIKKIKRVSSANLKFFKYDDAINDVNNNVIENNTGSEQRNNNINKG